VTLQNADEAMPKEYVPGKPQAGRHNPEEKAVAGPEWSAHSKRAWGRARDDAAVTHQLGSGVESVPQRVKPEDR
jgi:hypothetical protein